VQFYEGDVNLLVENINTVKKNTEALLEVNKDVGLKCMHRKLSMSASSHQTAAQYNSFK
jgi:hypothetical protein